jgi:hypothetical protein
MNGSDYFEFSTKCLDFGGLILKFLVVSKKILNFRKTNTAVYSPYYVKRKLTCYIYIFLDMRNDKLLETHTHKVERLGFELQSRRPTLVITTFLLVELEFMNIISSYIKIFF